MDLLVTEEKLLDEERERQRRMDLRSQELNYEEYYQTYAQQSVQVEEEAVAGFEAETFFDDDIAQMHFETPRERENRIRETWLDLKRKNALMGPDARTTEEQLEIQEEIVERCRSLRWKMD